MKINNKTLLSFILTLACIGLTFLLAGTYYNASDDAMIHLLLKGNIGGVQVSYFPRFFHGSAFVLAYLYKEVPSIPWLPIYYLFLLGSTFYLFSKSFLLLYPKKVKTAILLLVIVYFLVFIENVMYFSFNRVSILITGSSAFYFFVFYPKLSLLQKIVIVTFILQGILLRPMTAYWGLVFGLGGSSFWIEKKDLKPLLVPFLVLFILVTSIHIITHSTHDVEMQQAKKRNYYKSNILDYHLVNNQSLSQKDSLLLEGVYVGIYADNLMDNSFYERVTSGSKLELRRLFKKKRVTNKAGLLFFKLGWDYAWYSANVLFLIILNIHQRKKIVSILVIVVSTILLLIALGVLYKLPDKVLGPTLTLSAFILILLGFHTSSNQVIGKMVLGGMFTFCIVYGIKLTHRIQSSQVIQETKHNQLQELTENFGQQHVLVFKFTNILTYMSPWKNLAYPDKNKLVCLTGWPTLLPAYGNIYHHVYQEKSFEKVILKASQKNNHIFVVFEKESIVFLKKYFKYFYQTTLEITEIEPRSREHTVQQQYYYKIKIKE